MIFLSLIIMLRNNIKQLSRQQQEQYLINNGRRYYVTIPNYFKEQNYIIYQACIFDSAFSRTYTLYFRFKALKLLHEQMKKQRQSDYLPEFPKTKSFCLWNKTNQDPKMIQDRIRDLQFYLVKLLNNGQLLKLKEIQYIRKSIRKSRQQRSSSNQHAIRKYENQDNKIRLNECPEFHKKKQYVINTL